MGKQMNFCLTESGGRLGEVGGLGSHRRDLFDPLVHFPILVVCAEEQPVLR